ncbi:2-C-methyl-D-erythritol 4-phosphate cytidylyltransferase [Amycolatopsis sp. 195334CR]|nr:2-C-methyl-D-erythritol 4-phosphate cytidylyltransferase [Amycolatopsis sp. 195334CR]
MLSAVTTAAGVVLASGSGSRVGAELNKVYLPLAGRRLVRWSLDAFARLPEFGVLVLVIRPEDEEFAREVVGDLDVDLVHGGASRQGSELCALRHLATRIDAGEVDTVLIHDGARPLASDGLITAVLKAAREFGGAVPGLAADDVVIATEDGTGYGGALDGAVRVQTPQGFLAGPLLAAYEQADREGFIGTDTASCMERFSSLPVHWVPGEERNLKVTYPHDLRVVEHLLRETGLP